MVEKIINYVILFIGVSLGVGAGIYLNDSAIILINDQMNLGIAPLVISIVVPVLFGIISLVLFYFLSKFLVKFSKKIAENVQGEIEKISPQELIVGLVGLLGGLVVALIISSIYDIIPIPIISDALTVLSYIFFGYLGTTLAQKNFSNDFTLSDVVRKVTKLAKEEEKKIISDGRGKPKILDTSVIIDGRISDICKTGFIEGDIIIPEFVLKELRHIADSSDGLKRNRGRRGLDILKIIQNESAIEVKIVDTDFEDVDEVDIKLIKLAQKIDGIVVTNDYNLNKVATLQDVQILNINELANAVKSIVIPGEEMVVQIMKSGKEQSQGVAYLDDGTMIVVEDGRKFIGETKRVIVTSVLQTAAGRMIFAKAH